MNKIRKCKKCGKYTFNQTCDLCKLETFEVMYKFSGLRDDKH